MATNARLKMGVPPDEIVAHSTALECTPLDVMREFIREVMIAKWVISTITLMAEKHGDPMFAWALDQTQATMGNVLIETFEAFKKNDEFDTTKLQDEVWDEFNRRLGDYVKEEREVTAAEVYAQDAIAKTVITKAAA